MEPNSGVWRRDSHSGGDADGKKSDKLHIGNDWKSGIAVGYRFNL
jgi:hypothetical protein